MMPITCSATTDGTLVGVGYTCKFVSGKKNFINAYYVRKKYHVGAKCTLKEVRPELYKVSEEMAMLMTTLLGLSLPTALLECIRLAKMFCVPFLGESFTTGNFLSWNFRSVRHCNEDKGHAFAIALVFEIHKPGCANARAGKSCQHGWVFFVVELGVYIPLTHLSIFVFDSEHLEHGSSFDDHDPEGCESEGIVCVSQIKQSHHMKGLAI
jgi:hypothetical protein